MIDEELPYPPTSGKRIRTLNLTRRLAQRHRITFVCRRNANEDEARTAAEWFRDHGITPLIVDGRNLLDAEAARAAGFDYEGIGRA